MMELVMVMDEMEMVEAMEAMGLYAGVAYVEMEEWEDMVVVLMGDGIEYVFADVQEAFEYIVEQAEEWMW